MPELPEVETVRRGIEPLIVGQTIKSVVCRVPKLRWELDPELDRRLAGRTIQSVNRRAKYLLIGLGQGTLIMHLGMTGIIRVISVDIEPVKHDHFDIVLFNNQVLRMNDSRRFGAVIYENGPIENNMLFKDLGPEPLSRDFNSEYLGHRARNCKGPIKSFLMNQKVVVGVGNIYASEALFRSGIDPRKSANQLSQGQFEVLVSEIKLLLDDAIKSGGTTIRDFAGSDGKPGYFKQALQVYGREDQSCIQCFTPIQKVRLSGRSTFYCSKCQK